jgi:catechol 2,3-dioxygenase-like lactoylglutathione lyase family enzyme
MTGAEPAGVAPWLIDHVGIVVRDSEAASRRFEERLGLQVEHAEVVEAVGARLVYLVPPRRGDGPGTSVQLLEPLRPGRLSEHLDEHGEGPHHVCFAVDDLAHSLGLLGEPPQGVFIGGGGRRCCFLGEPIAGARIELIERPLEPRTGATAADADALSGSGRGAHPPNRDRG